MLFERAAVKLAGILYLRSDVLLRMRNYKK